MELPQHAVRRQLPRHLAQVYECYTRSVDNALRLLLLPFVVTAALDLQTPTTRPAAGVAPRIVGAWQLMTRTVTRADGTTIVDPVLGEKPSGRLVYDASGAMMLQMMRTGRKQAISTPANPKDASNARVILGYDSYFGRYTVDEKAGTVTHHVEGSLFPEDLGDDWVRPFTLNGDTLTLRLTGEDGLTRTLVFQRMR
jgi:hypothetical protein